MLPAIKTSIPGHNSKRFIRDLKRIECPHITYSDKDFPVFWLKAKGCNVTDADNNRYIDLTSAFAVSNLGHAPGFLKKIIRNQINQLWHAMGDVHPHVSKLHALKALKSILPKSLSRVIFSSSGSEAIETALKTAYLATNKPGVIAFEGSYHGLGYGAMLATHRKWFREPFIRQTGSFVTFKPFVMKNSLLCGEINNYLKRLKKYIHDSAKIKYGAILIEAIQGRAGIREADHLFLKGLRRICDDEGMVLICDEIFSGFARTGKWFGFQHARIMPDIVCLGKGMANGFPISACIAKKSVMQAWGPSNGEAKHTSTFLGHPMGCAMISAVIKELKRHSWDKKVSAKSVYVQKRLKTLQDHHPLIIKEIRGLGLMLGIVFRRDDVASIVMKKLLKKGIIILSSGEKSETLSFTPPFTINKKEIDFAIKTLDGVLSRL